MKRQIAVLVGAGSIGQAIIRRVAAGMHIVLADYDLEHARQAALPATGMVICNT